MAVVPIIIDIPIWNNRYIYNHVPRIPVTTSADVGTGATLTQYVSDLAVAEIEITINAGVLPADNSGILVITDQGGVILPGVSEGQWTADRVSDPNRIILNTVPDVPFNLSITISV